MGNAERHLRGDASCVLGVGPTPLARGFCGRRWLLVGGLVGPGRVRRLGSVQLGVAAVTASAHRQIRTSGTRRQAAPRLRLLPGCALLGSNPRLEEVEQAEPSGRLPRSACSGFNTAVKIRHRPPHGPRPSVDLDSALEWSEARQRARVAAQAQRDAGPAPEPIGPPDRDDVWLDVTTVSALLGCSAHYVGRLARDARLPATRHGGSLVVRRQHAEQYAAAKAFRLRRRAV